MKAMKGGGTDKNEDNCIGSLEMKDENLVFSSEIDKFCYCNATNFTPRKINL